MDKNNMINANPGFAIEREIQVKKIKRLMDNWREITLVMNSILLWKKKYFPWLIVGITTFIFMEFAYYSPSFLTSLGLICFVAILVDFGGPSVSCMVWGNEGWTTAKEREFEDVCRALAGAYVHFKQAWGLLIDLKATSPLKYFTTTLAASLTLAMVGNTLNNVLVLYLFCLSLLMLPGVLHYGILQKYYNLGLSHVVKLLRSLNSSGSKTKVQ